MGGVVCREFWVGEKRERERDAPAVCVWVACFYYILGGVHVHVEGCGVEGCWVLLHLERRGSLSLSRWRKKSGSGFKVLAVKTFSRLFPAPDQRPSIVEHMCVCDLSSSSSASCYLRVAAAGTAATEKRERERETAATAEEREAHAL